MAALPPFSFARIHSWVDSLGAAGAVLCALHCALLPVALALLPALSSGWVTSQGVEIVFSSCATLLAVASLWQGYKTHRAYHAWLFVVPGLVLLWAALLWPALHHSVWPHALAMALGGVLVAAAHLLNLRLTRSHGASACCTA